MDHLADSSTNNRSKDRLNNIVAVCVAVLAAFMAVTKVKDDNIVQAMLQDKSDAVDTWSEYQAKRIKHHLVEMGRDQTIALRSMTNAQNTAGSLDEQLKKYEAEIERYKQDEHEIQDKARGFEAQYDALNYRDDQFDLSDAALSVSLAMLAVTSLTGKRWLLGVSLLFAAFGVVIGLAGLLGMHLHPDALTKLLS